MAQNGMHGLIGVAVVRMAGKKVSGPARSFGYGFVAGSVLPDVDLAPLALTYFFDPRLAMRMHRTATHSLIVIGCVTLLGVLSSSARGGRSFFRGLGAGMALHSLIDVFLWFSGIDILWPLGHLGIPSRINLWAEVNIPPLLQNLLGSTNFLMMALFYGLLVNLAGRYDTNPGLLPKLRGFRDFHYACFAVYFVLSFLLNRTAFDVAAYAVIVLVTLPMTCVSIVGSRPTLERLATPGPGPR